MNSEITIDVVPFAELSVQQLYAVLRLRSEVFVVEQQCIYQDLDNKDPHSSHVLVYQGSDLVGCARIVPPGLSYPGPSIGRVCIASSARRQGFAARLMRVAIEHVPTASAPLEIGAQVYLQTFYQSLGFTPSSQPYDEDGIMHIDMVYQP
ncbi:MAG: GNAT family N-acetyltransferase [Glaciecola sp.]|jgi:ElaA protein